MQARQGEVIRASDRLVGRDVGESCGLGLALVTQEVIQTQSLRLRLPPRRP